MPGCKGLTGGIGGAGGQDAGGGGASIGVNRLFRTKRYLKKHFVFFLCVLNCKTRGNDNDLLDVRNRECVTRTGRRKGLLPSEAQAGVRDGRPEAE